MKAVGVEPEEIEAEPLSTIQLIQVGTRPYNLEGFGVMF